MGAAISSSLTMGVTYCCFTAMGNLCNACLGSTAPGTTGRKRSVLLLTMAIALALIFQYCLGPAIVTQSGWMWKAYRWIPGLGKAVYEGWYDSCQKYYDADNKEANTHLLEVCAGNAGVYRPMSVAALFFAATAVATKVNPSLNREAWPSKYAIYFFLVSLTVFLQSAPLFTGAFLWIARFGATIFVILQQVILIDLAYNWNEDWVNRADQADRLDYGTGAVWLRAIVATCFVFYILTFIGIYLLYRVFDECAENTWIITLTLLGVLALTGIQLSGTEGSLLTSSVMSLYVTYLAYGMVSKNPNYTCNPQLGNNDVWGIVIGLTLTAISLAWTGWSWTAQDRLNVEGVQSAKTVTSHAMHSSPDGVNLDVPFLDPDEQPPTGLVMDQNEQSGHGQTDSGVGRDIWKINVVMTLICFWVAMTLTGWGTIEIGEADESSMSVSMANPTVGRVNMAMIGISQWVAIGLYVWTLVAPRMFPDRDFS